MNTAREKRLKYLGFNDRWFSLIGIIVLAASTIYVFNTGAQELTVLELVITITASLFFSATDWLINRKILIRLRKLYPRLEESTKRIGLMLFANIITVLTVDYIGIKIIMQISDKVHYSFPDRARSLVVIVFLTTMTMAIYEAIYFFVLLRKSVREEEQAKQAIIQAELDTLRNQAQPHFFFNTLNTLRDIIDQNPKEDAKQFVDKLADIYRFLLESGNSNLIPLKDELKFARAYIHVQSERFGDNLRVQWKVAEKSERFLVAPMSLQLLLENAIKHNVASRSKPLIIEVETNDNYIEVGNRIQKKSTQLPSTKMGLKNIKKRYALLTDRPVQIDQSGDEFKVSLPLLKPGK